MRIIDMESWSRRKHFELYSALDYPYFALCADVDLTVFHPYVKRRGHSMTVAITYALARASNAIPEFRCRIRGEEVVEHEVVHPSITVLTDEDLFTFCTITYAEHFLEFAERAAARIAYVREHPTLEDEPGHDNLLFMTAIPWVSFTSVVHPVPLEPPDSVPRLAWGKFFEDGEGLKMGLGVQAHHGVVDGLHVGRFYERVQDCFHHPESTLG